MFKKILRKLNFISDIWLMMISNFPGPAGRSLRYRYWKKRLKFMGNKVKIDTNVYFQNPGSIIIDDNSWIDKNVIILAGLDDSSREKIEKINKSYNIGRGIVSIGKNVHLAPNCLLSGIDSGIFIGNNCSIAAGSKLYSFSHHYRSKENPSNVEIYFSPLVDHNKQTLIKGPIYLGENVGVSVDCVILPGVTINKNSFLLPKSVIVGGSFPENSLISGYPAKKVNERFKNYVSN